MGGRKRWRKGREDDRGKILRREGEQEEKGEKKRHRKRGRRCREKEGKEFQMQFVFSLT